MAETSAPARIEQTLTEFPPAQVAATEERGELRTAKKIPLAVCLMLTFAFGMGLYVWPASFESATAFMVSSNDVFSQSLGRLAEEYSRSKKRLEAVTSEPEPEPVRYTVPAQPAKIVARSSALTSAPQPKVPNRTVLVNKVYRIIREHSPKNQNARALAEAIVSEAKEQSYDPLFVAAVIKSESTFNALARSNKGAQGLMQLMPATSAWLADSNDLPRGRLTDPGYNLQLGITYLKNLEESYNGDRVLTLIAYNWGPGHVESASGGKRRVPAECVTYAVKIMNDYRKWVHDVSL
jgi:soluble lytic murein transglycosylase-like protein